MYDSLIEKIILISGYDRTINAQKELKVKQGINILVSSFVCLSLLIITGIITGKGNESCLYTFSWLSLWIFTSKRSKGKSTLYSNLVFVGMMLIFLYVAERLKDDVKSILLIIGMSVICGIIILVCSIKWKNVNDKTFIVWAIEFVFIMYSLNKGAYQSEVVYSMIVFLGGMMVQSASIAKNHKISNT